MSRKAEYLTHAEHCLAMSRASDEPSTISVLKQAAQSWMLLARLEDQSGSPTRWEIPSPRDREIA